jgi:hypothetical protein
MHHTAIHAPLSKQNLTRLSCVILIIMLHGMSQIYTKMTREGGGGNILARVFFPPGDAAAQALAVWGVFAGEFVLRFPAAAAAAAAAAECTGRCNAA